MCNKFREQINVIYVRDYKVTANHTNNYDSQITHY